ncbi:MAG: triose-phosphate isomerase [Bombilactobacillus mellifer]|uniref:triose-phosphate isomerase n=1 Tax=Bombilactobacillus mellifer TaxID=1218492 RepID=UPI0023F31B23|nr:triose-phosphate isomerase [Bombilactobacillus mellifer]MCT6826474.1 triose-phosphate isomerase [Bombilactobacillus mellifer]MCT6895174.1 triose-phosphate isomerase [Bombilactobacillus mellifer]
MIKAPFFIVNPKSYLYGAEVVKLAKIADRLAQQYHIDCLFTGQLIDLPALKQATQHLIITAQTMDPLEPGRGMGQVLPEGLQSQGVGAVVLNHAEKPLTIAALDWTIKRARTLNLMSIVCADTPEQCRAVAQLHPTMMICEPTSVIGTGTISNDDYIQQTNQAVREVDPQILIMQAAGVSTGADVTHVLQLGADGTGGTSGIIQAPDWQAKLTEMMSALVQFKGE